MCSLLGFLLLSALSASANASLAALKGLDKATATGDVAEASSYCAPEVTCTGTAAALATKAFGPEKMSPIACNTKLTTALSSPTLGWMMASFDTTPVSETYAGSTGVATYAVSACKAAADQTCVPGTTVKGTVFMQYTFDAQDKVSSITLGAGNAYAEFVLSANESAARQKAIPVAGISITTFLLSALSIGCYQLGKKHGQAKVSGGYTSLIDA